jgi:hypothetical protein
MKAVIQAKLEELAVKEATLWAELRAIESSIEEREKPNPLDPLAALKEAKSQVQAEWYKARRNIEALQLLLESQPIGLEAK